MPECPNISFSVWGAWETMVFRAWRVRVAESGVLALHNAPKQSCGFEKDDRGSQNSAEWCQDAT